MGKISSAQTLPHFGLPLKFHGGHAGDTLNKSLQPCYRICKAVLRQLINIPMFSRYNVSHVHQLSLVCYHANICTSETDWNANR